MNQVYCGGGMVRSPGDLSPQGPSLLSPDLRGPPQGADKDVRTGGLHTGLFMKGKWILC